MELSGIPPPVMNWKSSNLPEQWEKFKLHVDLIFSGPLEAKTEAEKVSYLLLWIGEEGRQIYKTWTLAAPGTDPTKLDTYYKKFKAHVQPKLNPIFSRYRFNNEVQGSDSIDAFVTRLRLRAKDCSFAEEDNMIRDRIVFGCSNAKVRAKLIDEGDKLTMDKAVQISQNFEYCQQQLSSMTLSNPSNVDAVKQHTKKTKSGQMGSSKGHGRRHPKKHSDDDVCGNCGTVHKKDKCPAYGKICHSCWKKSHYSKMCRSKTVHEVSDQSACAHGYYEQDYSIDTVSALGSSPDRAFATLIIGPSKKSISFKVDTGSAVNILPYSHFTQLKLKHPLRASEQKLSSYTGDLLKVQGTIRLECCYKDKVIEALFYVVENSATPLIGLQSSLDLDLLQLTYSVESSPSSAPQNSPSSAPMSKQSVQNEFADLFTGVGVLPGKSKLYLKENVVPVVNPPRRVPEALKSRFKDELDPMEKDAIIARVTQPTDWVNSIVLVEKPKTGKLRVCLDPKALNDAIRRPHYQMPTLDDVRLSGAKTFSKLDITHAYWSIELEEESSYLTTFSTPFGRYRYLRLPFGISASSDLFQQKMGEICEGLSGVKAIVDDILVYGRSTEEHKNLRSLLERAREKGVRFNSEKCTIGVSEVPFFGHVISDVGLKADASKIEAIVNLEPPDCREKLETFLGMVNYMSKFAPNLAEITSPM